MPDIPSHSPLCSPLSAWPQQPHVCRTQQAELRVSRAPQSAHTASLASGRGLAHICMERLSMPRSDGAGGGVCKLGHREEHAQAGHPDLSPRAHQGPPVAQRLHLHGSHPSLPGTPAPELVVPVVSSLPVASGSGQTSPKNELAAGLSRQPPCVSSGKGPQSPPL